jgi:carboxypeptidase family protein
MNAVTVRRIVGVCLVAMTYAAVGFAQGDQGSIEGIVADQSGARIPNAWITATNTSSSAEYTADSNQEGLYCFLLLPTGNYDLEVRKSGFAEVLQRGVRITVGAKANLDFVLRIATSQNSVDVVDKVPLLETSRTPVTFTVDKASVSNLPANGRNFMDFVLLVPGVTRDVRTGELSFAGQRGVLNSLSVDGFDNNNAFFAQATGGAGTGRAPYQFSLDSVQEFQVNSNSFSAELGRSAAVVNVVTKSGSNMFHGTGFWFYRDRALTAFDPIVKLNDEISGTSTPKPSYHLNQFGGNIGGPIKKNRAFFFFNYDGQRNAQTNQVHLRIPAIESPTTFQQNAIDYLEARSASWENGENQDTYLIKGDWELNQNHNLSIRWNRQRFNGPGIENGGPLISLEDSGTSIASTDTIGASLTSVISTNLINVVRFGYLIDQEAGRANSDLPRAIVSEGGQTLLDIGRVSFDPRETTIHRQQYTDTLTFSHGRHTWKFGADFIYDNTLNFFPGNFSGSYSFDSLENFGRSLAGEPLIGIGAGEAGVTFTQAFAGTGTLGATTFPNIFQASWFVQDDWRLTHNLTLYTGIRWDLQKSAKSTINSAVVAADIAASEPNTDRNNLGPRFGFAWVPIANSPMVLRGGYGIFYGYTPSIMLSTAQSNNGLSIVTKTFLGSAIPSYPDTLCGAPVSSPNCAPPATGTSSPPSIYVFAGDYRQPVIQEANLNLERSFRRDLSLNIGWQMVKGNDLQRARDINLGTPTSATVTLFPTGQLIDYLLYPSTRPTPAFTRVSQFESSANSLYHGFFLQLRKEMSQKFGGTVSYTFGHVIDDAPDINAVVPFSPDDDSLLLSDPKRPQVDRSSGLDDERHRLLVSGIWQLDYADNLGSWMRAALGNWQVSMILSAQSGKPYTGLVNSDLNNDSNQYSDRIPTEGRNSFNLPASWTLNPRLSKLCNLGERARLELLVEAFNVFNHFNVPAVNNIQYQLTSNTLIPASGFGRPMSPGIGSNYPFAGPQNLNGARIFQLGAKISF